MLRWLFRLIVLLLLLLPLALAALALMALDPQALVASKVALTPAHVERAKLLLLRNDPRRMRAGVLRSMVVSQADLELAANYAASQYAHGAARIVLQDGVANLSATFELPANPVGRYLNLQARLVETAGLPRVDELRLGRVPVPAFVCDWLVAEAVARLQEGADRGAVADVVKQVSPREGLLQVTFVWSDAAAGQLKSALVPPEEQARWQAYQARLVELTSGGRARALTLDTLLVPLLQLAAQRAGSANAALENRAALVVLAFYVNGKGLAALVPQARNWPQPPARVVTLGGRTDFPQHFTISAALSATAGSPLSDVVGVYKEVDDARGGSGFSFNDIAADRAGTRLGALATTGNTAGAARLRSALDRGLRESDLLPDVRDLPEFMTEAEFQRRFGGVGQPAYQRQMADIERRIAALPLYR